MLLHVMTVEIRFWSKLADKFMQKLPGGEESTQQDIPSYEFKIKCLETL